MLRVLGGICIIGATTLFGMKKGAEIQNTYRELQYLERLMYQLQSEIRYLKVPLGDIFRRLGKSGREPYNRWFSELGQEMEQRGGTPFRELWKSGIRHHLSGLHLPDGEIERLSELGSQLGSADMEQQMKILELYQRQLSQVMEDLRESMDHKIRLCRSLGVISGIFLVIVLL